jgi:hypothetical protein
MKKQTTLSKFPLYFMTKMLTKNLKRVKKLDLKLETSKDQEKEIQEKKKSNWQINPNSLLKVSSFNSNSFDVKIT